jgi:hypothetical protein
MNPKHDQDISSLYQSAEDVHSPKSVDELILAQAKSHAESLRKPLFQRPQFYALSASSCVLVLAVSLVFNAPKPSEIGSTTPSLKSAPSLMRAAPEAVSFSDDMAAESGAVMALEEKSERIEADLQQSKSQFMSPMSAKKKASDEHQLQKRAHSSMAASPSPTTEALETIDRLIAEGKREEAQEMLTALLEAMPHLKKNEAIIQRLNTLQTDQDE